MTTEVEIFYQNTVLESIPVTEVDVIEVVTEGPQGPRGDAGFSGGSITLAAVPTGAINGINMAYATSVNFAAIWVYLNGLRMKPGEDFSVTGANTFLFAYPPQTGDKLIVDYIPA